MKSHIRARKTDEVVESLPSSSQSSAVYDDDTYLDSAILFEEHAVVAAASLASAYNVPLESLGVLFDRVFETGSLPSATHRRGHAVKERSRDIESALFRKGKVLIVVKEASETEASQLLNSGLRFASVQQVSRTIANSVQIPVSALESYISELKRYNENLQAVDKTGTWLSFFAMLPKPHGKGFDVVVKKCNNNQLPDVKLLDGRLQPCQQSLLDKLDGEKVFEVLALLEDRTGILRSMSARDLQFVATLRQAIVQLTAPFPRDWVRDARFWSKQLEAHYCSSLRTTIYAFTVIGDIHASIEGSLALARIPLRFFDARHRVYPGSSDHAVFAQEIRDTFDPIFAKRQPKHTKHATGRYNLPKFSPSFSSHHFRAFGHRSHTSGSAVSRTPSPSPMVEIASPYSTLSVGSIQQRTSSPMSGRGFGDIHVQRETSVKIDDLSDFLFESPRSDARIGQKVAITNHKPEYTFVNELMEITKERFKPAFNAAAP